MKVIVTTSTFPLDEHDVVPTFVRDQMRTLSALDNTLEIYILIPHHAYSDPIPDRRRFPTHEEIRFHYCYPHRLEKLSGRGILPALKNNPLLFAMIPFFLWGQRRALKRLCREVQPDLIYAHWFVPQAVVAAGVARHFQVPLMFTSHASDVSILKNIPFSRILIRRCLLAASRFSAVSQRTANKMISLFSDAEWEEKFAEKFAIIPMGTDYADSSRSDVTSVPEGNDLNSDVQTSPYILFLGRLTEKKGIRFLIDAYSKIVSLSNQETTRLVIAGDGELMEQLKNSVIKADLVSQIEFVGYVSGKRKSALVAGAEIVIIPSIVDSQGDSEGMPVVLMEALSFGRRVIATTESGAEEILDSGSGLLVEPNSVDALVSAICVMQQQSQLERKRMEVRALACSQQFSWNSVGQRYHALMQEAVGYQ